MWRERERLEALVFPYSFLFFIGHVAELEVLLWPSTFPKLALFLPKKMDLKFKCEMSFCALSHGPSLHCPNPFMTSLLNSNSPVERKEQKKKEYKTPTHIYISIPSLFSKQQMVKFNLPCSFLLHSSTHVYLLPLISCPIISNTLLTPLASLLPSQLVAFIYTKMNPP